MFTPSSGRAVALTIHAATLTLDGVNMLALIHQFNAGVNRGGSGYLQHNNSLSAWLLASSPETTHQVRPHIQVFYWTAESIEQINCVLITITQ